jgi:hypothetical protein
MMEAPPLAALFVVGALSVLSLSKGWLFVSGRLQSIARHYFEPEKSIFARHLPFAHLPLGVGGLALCIAGIAGYLPPKIGDPIIFLMVGVAGAALFITARCIGSPPKPLKPEWLRLREQRMPQGLIARTDRADLILLGGLQLLAAVMMAIGFIAFGLVLFIGVR